MMTENSTNNVVTIHDIPDKVIFIASPAGSLFFLMHFVVILVLEPNVGVIGTDRST